ncbi:hypothetical protein RJ639_045574, partial [Escallonia herrerae]
HLLLATKSICAPLTAAGVSDVQVSTPQLLGILLTYELPSAGRLRRGYHRIIDHLLPATKSICAPLTAAGVSDVQVSTPQLLGILLTYEPPSAGRLRRGYHRIIFTAIIDFHQLTKSSFMVCPYPFFGFNNNALNYPLFKPNDGVSDKKDTVNSAIKKVGYGDMDIVVFETGWPSSVDPSRLGMSLDNAVSYNANLVKHVNSGQGTPLLPNITFENYIFWLFNEDLKPSTS